MDCAPYPVSRSQVELPNCDDAVFRMWCNACGLRPGDRYDYRDLRIARLEELMQGRYDPTYDPESDTDDDYLLRGFR